MQSIQYQTQRIQPSKILCVGRNYVEHIHELGNPIPEDMVVFHKPNAAISTQLFSQHGQETLHYEAELCFLVWAGQLAAVGFGLDLTKRETQSRLKSQGLPWEKAKAFNGSALFSSFVSLADLKIEQLSFELLIDGITRQQGRPQHMLYTPEVILSHLAQYTTLEDGDIIMTGTPAGVAAITPQSTFCGRVFHQQELLIEQQWQAL